MKYNINIPESLEDIKLDNLIKFSKADQENEEEIKVKAFDLFCNTPLSLLRDLPNWFVEETINKIAEVLSMEQKDVMTFEMDGTKYGRIPNLSKVKFGEYADLDTFITPLFKGEIKHEDAFKFLATIYRPIKEETNGLYRIVDYDDEYIGQEHWIKFKQHCPAHVYLSTVGFFLNLKNELQKVTQSYLQALEKSHPQHANNLAKIGAGMEVCTAMQKERIGQLNKSARTLFSLPLHGFHTKQTVEN